ncbi:MAG: hypothetical protein R3B09_21795 [Nannocystaceae bacterium]
MLRPRLRLWFPASLPLVTALACAEGDGAGSSFSGGSAAITSATVSSTGAGSTGETSDETTDAGESDGGSATDPGTSGDGTSTSTTGGGTTGNPNGLPNGSECTDPAMCMSGNCYTIPLPINDLPAGICGVCDEDQDCVDAGLGISCSVDVAGYTSKCTDGALGSFCQSQAACKDGLYCQELIPGVGGLLPMSCSECRDDGDCPGSARCTPKIDVDAYNGNKYCAQPGSVANDEMCPLEGGDAVCLSGHCTVVDVGGLIMAGVCGECSTNADCGGGTCTAGKWSDGFVGSVCG